MWLINTASLALEAVENPEDFKYAILSHTWEHGEVSFQEMADLERAKPLPGFSKISKTCSLARELQIPYAWVDTCCIDKRSSAELTEAINSMFRWYKRAVICFVFLSDLPSQDNAMDGYFSQCRWFTRGWTLQELIASKEIKFYDQNWDLKGTKFTLRHNLSEITGIETGHLMRSDMLHIVPVARRMSWAASRCTTRVEDLAYCLFGIFDVNLPLIYGEGPKAFIRLQEAIARENNDPSLFAWSSMDDNQQYRGIFAKSPSEFRKCGNLLRISDPTSPGIEFVMSNRGVSISSRLNIGSDDYLLNLHCYDSSIRETEGTDGIFVLRLVRTALGYVRHKSNKVVLVSPSRMEFNVADIAEPVFVPKVLRPPESSALKRQLSQNFVFRVVNTSSLHHEVSKRPGHLWDNHTRTFITSGHETFTGLLEIDITGTRQIVVDILNRKVGDYQRTVRGRHSSNYIAIFGLEPYGRNEPGFDWSQIWHHRPWVALYRSNKSDAVPSSQLLGYMSQEFSHGLPYVLNQVRTLLLSHKSSGNDLPGTLTFTPSWRLENPSPTMSQRELFQLSDRLVKGPSVHLDFSAKRREGSEGSMYELILKIEHEN